MSIAPTNRLATQSRAYGNKVCLRRLLIERNLVIHGGGFRSPSCGFNRQAARTVTSRLATQSRAYGNKVCLRRLLISENLVIREGGFCSPSCGFNRQAAGSIASLYSLAPC